MFIESSLWEEILMKVHYFVHLRVIGRGRIPNRVFFAI